MKKFFLASTFAAMLLTAMQSQAKIWRVNNNPGISADFTTFNAAATSVSVLAGDTVHIESSPTGYTTGSITLSKRLIVIGVGYFLDPSNSTYPANTGLQAAQYSSALQGFSIGNGAANSKFMGLEISSVNFTGSASAYNITFEKCFFTGSINFTNAVAHDGVTVRKSFFSNAAIQGTTGTLTNFVCENNIFYTTFGYINLPILIGSTNILRNNSFKDVGAGPSIVNCYVANNVFGTPAWNFTNCTIKNNLFAANQTLPGTATNNQVNVNMTNVYVGGATGSQDSRAQLKAGSPALAAGLTIGAVVTPDCGAYGATDPYKLSGIPGIPSIYALNVPISIPSGSATMNITFSTRNNN